MITINWDKYLDFDAQTPPPAMREVVFVKGTPYEMGKQYGAQKKEMIKRNFCLVAGDALKNYTKEQIVERVTLLSKDIATKAPDIHEWYKGIADGAEMSYGDIALINIQLWVSIPYMMCSSVAATGDATADGKTIAGVNGDITYNMSGYGITLVAFPSEGNAFVTLPQLAGQLGANFAMNDKGLIITFDGGESEQPEDTKFGFADFISAMVLGVWKNDTAEAANEYLKTLEISGGWIYLMADKTGKMCILEHTSAHDATRYPGDYGEKNYIHAANHFIDPEMRKSSIEYKLNEDSYHRYDTEEKIMSDMLGEMTLDKMMRMMASHDSWIDGEWIRDTWGLEQSWFSPEMHSPDFRTGTRGFGVAEDCDAYILHGSEDPAVSYIPGSTGKYAKIPVRSTPDEVLEGMENDAVMEAWEAAKRIRDKGYSVESDNKLIDMAREHIFAGKNYISKLNLYKTFDEEEARKHYGYAASEFSYAYVISQLIK